MNIIIAQGAVRYASLVLHANRARLIRMADASGGDFTAARIYTPRGPCVPGLPCLPFASGVPYVPCVTCVPWIHCAP